VITLVRAILILLASRFHKASFFNIIFVLGFSLLISINGRFYRPAISGTRFIENTHSEGDIGMDRMDEILYGVSSLQTTRTANQRRDVIDCWHVYKHKNSSRS